MVFFILQISGLYFYYFGYLVSLRHWLRVPGSPCQVNTSRESVAPSECLTASPRSLSNRLHPTHDTLRVKNLSIGWHFHVHLIYYPSKIQVLSMGIITKCMQFRTKPKFETVLPSCYRVLMHLCILSARLEVFPDSVDPLSHIKGYAYSVSGTYVTKRSYYDPSVSRNHEISEIVKIESRFHGFHVV